ncbi:hypothetical protein ABPG77_006068 [Micractinium sp. CCAP 211/92]
MAARQAVCLVLLAAAAAVLLPLAAAQGGGQQPSGPTYYIAADQITWNYAPAGVNLCTGEQFTGDATLWTQLGVGSNYTKAQYRQYTDATFQTLQPKSDADEHTGLLGPVMRAAVGQVLTVVLKNNLDFPINLQPAGVEAYLAPGSSPAANAAAALSPTAQPNATVTYRFLVPAAAGPSANEPSAKLWLYRSTVDLVAHANAGLVGPLLISNTPEVNTGDVASGQERDIITVLQIIDEGSSPYLDTNLANRTAAQLGVTDAGLVESFLKHGINGYLFCNAPGMVMTQGERVRWHMATVGSEGDMHNLHLHGNTFLNNGRRADHLSMIPGTARSVQFSTENAGFWLMHCHVGDHILGGMKAMYMVQANDSLPELAGPLPEGGTLRRYYIEAEEVEWNYAPLGGDFCSGELLSWTPDQAVFTVPNHLSLGSKFKKGRYIEYTDDTFTTEKPGDPSLGLVGPVIRAEVGDTIEVVFKNSLPFPATIHPHGVAYLKNSEGSPYFDGTMGADVADDQVPTGGVYTYRWQVPESSGPGPADPSTIVWMYHSHTNEVRDVYAGLVGAIVIGRKGELKEDLTGKDVDREVVVYFSVINEVMSLYADENAEAMGFTSIDAWESVAEGAFEDQTIAAQELALATEQQAAGPPAPPPARTFVVAPPAAATPAAPSPAPGLGRRLLAALARQQRGARRLQEEEEEEGYEEPMLKHVINGFLYCNMPVLNFTQGENVRFHIMALGTEVDLHTPNFVGQSMKMDQQRTAATSLMPGAMHTVDVTMVNPGTAVLQCRIADHITAGMRALINVTASAEAGANLTAALAAAPAPKRYFIAAEEIDWDYVPTGKDGCTGQAFDDAAKVFVERTNVTIGSKYRKAVYRQYTDATFTTKVAAPTDALHGILGPTMTVEVGQQLEVVFRNLLPFPANLMLDGGLELVPATAGSAARDPEAAVAPNATATTRYYVPESAGPAENDLSTIAYTYTSSVDLVGHPNAGLIGVVVVASKGALDGTTGLPTGVNAMVPLLFNIQDEASSPLLDQNIAAANLSVAATFDPAWGESNLMHSINGYMYCNLPGLAAKRGDTVRLILVGMGSEADLHSPIFTGQVLRGKSLAMHTAELLPTVTQEVDVTLEQAGSWPVYCEVHDHYLAGMRATLVVS